MWAIADDVREDPLYPPSRTDTIRPWQYVSAISQIRRVICTNDRSVSSRSAMGSSLCASNPAETMIRSGRKRSISGMTSLSKRSRNSRSAVWGFTGRLRVNPYPSPLPFSILLPVPGKQKVGCSWMLQK
jgi:hypothetical protein